MKYWIVNFVLVSIVFVGAYVWHKYDNIIGFLGILSMSVSMALIAEWARHDERKIIKNEIIKWRIANE